MYRITWLNRTTDGLHLNNITTPSPAVAVTLILALKASPWAIAPRLWTKSLALVPA